MSQSISIFLKHKFSTTVESSFQLDVNFETTLEGVTGIFGPSGSGKTSLLRCLAGLIQPHESKIKIGDKTLQDNASFTPPHKRNLAFVFQEGSLLSHLTIRKNIDYVIRRSLNPPDSQNMNEILELLEISSLMNQYPSEISGGERQRVAIAKALARCPDLLLMDEPLASLDLSLKQKILNYLKQVKDIFKVPVFYVTHSLEELDYLADNVIALKNGRVDFNGDVRGFYSSLAQDPGSSLSLQAKVKEVETHGDFVIAELPGGRCYLPKSQTCLSKASIPIRFRSENLGLTLSNPENTNAQGFFQCKVIQVKSDSTRILSLEVENQIFDISLPPGVLPGIRAGHSIFALIPKIEL